VRRERFQHHTHATKDTNINVVPQVDSHHPTSDSDLRRRVRITFENIGSLRPSCIRTPWREARCIHCGALLLASEGPAWCCKNDAKVFPSLPPLPQTTHAAAMASPRSTVFLTLHMHSTTCSVSVLAASVKASQNTKVCRLQISIPMQTPHSCFLLGGVFSLAIEGRTYHRIFPTLRTNHPAHWFLYDPQARWQSARSCCLMQQPQNAPLLILAIPIMYL
jgi:hypothetical protein